VNNTVTHTGVQHADGGVVHHADDGDGHSDTLSEHVEKHEETDDGNSETRGADERSRLNSVGRVILVVIHSRCMSCTSKETRRSNT